MKIYIFICQTECSVVVNHYIYNRIVIVLLLLMRMLLGQWLRRYAENSLVLYHWLTYYRPANHSSCGNVRLLAIRPSNPGSRRRHIVLYPAWRGQCCRLSRCAMADDPEKYLRTKKAPSTGASGFDSKKWCWVPDENEGFLAGEIKSRKGSKLACQLPNGSVRP